jgi:tetraacyldisaccharide 4'-kinase
LVGSEIAGDEAVLLAELCPGVAVFVGKRREQAIAEAGAAHANLAILDDGFQYFRMRRDMDILVVNALQRGPALRMFPAGILREPAHAIRCADQIWITHAQAVTKDKLQELVGWCRKRAPKAPIVITTHTICRFRGFMLGETVSPAGLTVVAFCGIGSPEAFRASLECSGVSTVELWPFPDHYRYTEMDLQLVAEWAQDKGADLVVTTAKDAVRIKKELWPDQAPPLVVADVALAVEQGIEYVEEVIKGWSRVPGRHAHYAGDPRAGRPSKK